MENERISRFDIIFMFATMSFFGFFSFFLSFSIIINIFGNHYLNQVIGFILKLTTDNDIEYKSNSLIFILLVIFLLGYQLFTFFMVKIENVYWTKNEMHILNKVNYQRKFYGILTFGIVLFGFIPVVIVLFDEIQEVKNSAITYFMSMSLLLLYPYLYFARKEGNIDRELNTEQIISTKIGGVIHRITKFFSLKINHNKRYKKTYGLLLIGVSLIGLSLIITFVALTINKLIINS